MIASVPVVMGDNVYGEVRATGGPPKTLARQVAELGHGDEDGNDAGIGPMASAAVMGDMADGCL